ncbi:MAG: right-handed parallel beta-helix repeat-containing protein [Sphingobacteriales bacterium]|nr:MAG: right-handed parallel beta-helix repeat-containing protein [Sphingobacteriales bacterium]
MRMYFIFLLIGFLNLSNIAGQTFYVSSAGNDNNSGLSPKEAWRTLNKINEIDLKKGSYVLLEGGAVFNGNIQLDEKDGGSEKEKVIISSFGKGKATINAGSGTGIFVYNTSGISISKIRIRGDGVEKNNGSGIHFFADNNSKKLSGIEIKNCEVTGFHFYGILIQSDKDTACGFNNVQITDCIASENGEAGIGSLAAYPGIPHKNFRIVKCKVFNNYGILTKTDNHSGNGIVLSGVKKFLIDSCEAYENGKDCRSNGGGPVGIWVWHCKNGGIQNSVSHHNHAGTCLHDGGGFDIDGGSSYCTISNCISYDNEGAGYLVCEFGSVLPFSNNKVINNSSRNDGLKNGYGAITVSGAGREYPVTNTRISNNRIIVENKNTVDGVPAAIDLNNSDMRNILFENNSFEIRNGSVVMRSDSLVTASQVDFKNNRFLLKDSQLKVVCGKCKASDENFWFKLLKKK